MGRSRAEENKRIRQEAMREQLAAYGHHTEVVKIAEDLRTKGKKMKSEEISAKKAAADIHLKLLDKYLPNLKSVELVGDIHHKHVVKVIDLSGLNEEALEDESHDRD